MNKTLKYLLYSTLLSLVPPQAWAGKISPRPDTSPTSSRIQQLKPLPPLKRPGRAPSEEPSEEEAKTTTEQGVQLSGELQIRMGPPRPVVGTPDDVRANLALGMEITFAEAARLTVTGLYQQQVTDPPELDEAYLSLGNLDTQGIQVDAGRLYAPFGTYATDMINDPLTLFMGETKGDGLQVQLAQGPAHLQLFAYDNPLTNRDSLQWAARLGVSTEREQDRFDVAISYSSALAAAGTFQDTLTDLSDSPDALGILVQWRNADWRLTAEYIGATDSFRPTQLSWKGNGARPAAGHVELAHTSGRWTTALASQWTEQAVGLGLPQRRHSLSIQYQLTDAVSVGVEVGQETDYGVSVGGTGKTDDYGLAQITVSF